MCRHHFDHAAYLNQDFTTARWKLLEAIEQLQPQGGTSYDSALLATPFGALNIATRGQHRRVIVLLTDGQSDIDEGVVIARANAVGATIYCVTIGLDAPPPLQRIATQTGGFRIQNVNNEAEARQAYRLILGHARFGGLCTIRWRSGSACSPQRDLQISIPRLKASGRASYRAPAIAITQATAIGGVRGRSELPAYVERAQRGEIPLDTCITHRMGLEDINRAFDLMHEGHSIRSVILF